MPSRRDSPALPVAGAAAAELAPNRQAIDRKVAAAMVGTAVVNATGEELLWPGAYLDAFPDDPVAWGGLALGRLHPLASCSPADPAAAPGPS